MAGGSLLRIPSAVCFLETVGVYYLGILISPGDRRNEVLAGFQAYLAKPVEGKELFGVVANLAGRTGQ
jgi:hypothetical protein